MLKRKQYYISQYKFKNVKEENGKLTLDPETKVSYPISENDAFHALYKITNHEYKDTGRPEDNPIDEMIIFRSPKVETKKETELDERIIREGIYINGIHYVYDLKSSSMTRTQKTIYTREDLKDKITEDITLGKQPELCVPPKWITTKGYMLSSAYILDDLQPRICVIEDFEKTINKDVYIIEKYKPKDEDKEEIEKYYIEKQAEDDRLTEYYLQRDEANEILTDDYLKENFHITYGNNIKSKNGWMKEDKRVKPEELLKPCGYNIFEDKYKKTYYPVYSLEQTEDIKHFPIKPYVIGYEKKFYLDYPCNLNCFDGQGLMTFEYAEKIRKRLRVDYDINSIQMRMNYIKANVIRFDIRKYCLEQGIDKIKDINGLEIPINDIDIIITKSCFKAYLEKAENKNPCLFSGRDEYYKDLHKYEHNSISIANYSQPHKCNEYNALTYQFINSMELNLKDIMELSKETGLLFKYVLAGDTPSTLMFLNIISHTSDDEDEENSDYEIKEDDTTQKSKTISDAIKLNERMIFDPEVQSFLRQRVNNYYADMLIGRILVPSQFLVATGDCIAFIQWACFRDENKVTGFLKNDDLFCAGKNEEYIVCRYPQTHHSELSVHSFVENNNPYIQHLDNIIQCSTYSDIMFRKNLDFDGDKLFIVKANMPLSNGRKFIDAVIEDYPIYNPDDKTVTDKIRPFDIDAIVSYEMMNLQSKTGKITNINSTYQTKALGKGSLLSCDFESAICKYLQGQIIDSTKKGIKIEIPDELIKNTTKKPSFMKFRYGGDDKDYLYPESPLDKFAEKVDKRLKESNYFNDPAVNIPPDKQYLDIPYVYLLMIDESKFDSATKLDLLEKLRPIFKEYSTEKGKIYNDSRDINRLDRSEESKEALEDIKYRYSKLYEETRRKCLEICDNKSVLASMAVIIDYVFAKSGTNGYPKNKSFNFPWVISPEGILENLKTNEDPHKTILKKVTDEDIEKQMSSKNNLDFLGRTYSINKKIQEAKIKIPESERMEMESEIKKLDNYKCKCIHCVGKEAAKKLDNKKVRLNIKDTFYLSLFIGNDPIASIRKEDWINIDKKIDLKNYVDHDFMVNVTKVYDKSLEITLSQLD